MKTKRITNRFERMVALTLYQDHLKMQERKTYPRWVDRLWDTSNDTMKIETRLGTIINIVRFSTKSAEFKSLMIYCNNANEYLKFATS